MSSCLNKPIAAKSGANDRSLWLPLWMHSADTAGIMARLWDDWLPEAVCAEVSGGYAEAEMRRLCILLGLIHDIGKATAAFQGRIAPLIDGAAERLADSGLYIEPDLPQSVPHAAMGEMILKHICCPDCIAAIVGAHHGKPLAKGMTVKTEFDMNCGRYFGRQEPQWERLWKEIFYGALEYCGYGDVDELPKVDVRQQMLLCGMLIMADWIASSQGYFPLIAAEDAGAEREYPGRVEKGWESIGLPGIWRVYGGESAEELFAERFGYEPYPVQSMAMKHAEEAERPGIFILEAQMGCGKTEAALAAAEIFARRNGCGGIFFGLPTQATANGIFPRLERWAEKQPECNRLALRLAHGMAELNEDYRRLFHGGGSVCDEDGECGRPMVHEWFEGKKVALLSNFVIGTVDQLLMAALKQKHVMLRHLGLAGKAVIVDEVHAYDAYMNQYLDRALNWLGKYGVPVILLSATLPAGRREELIKAYLGKIRLPDAPWKTSEDYPLLTWTEGGAVKQDTVCGGEDGRTVLIERICDGEIAEELSGSVSEGGCACVIMNTVERAQRLAEGVMAAMPDADVMLFHAQFIMADRAEREREILRRLGKDSGPKERNRLIVIGTQVLEQSLDIDADVMITDLCPMDLLLQRMGRLHRHRRHDEMRPGRLKEARCCVVTPEDGGFEEGAKAIYGEWPLMRTGKLLPDSISLPGDIPALVQAAYDEENIPEDERAQREDFERRRGEARKRAKTYRIPSPNNMITIDGLFSDSDTINSDSRARAAVRDGEPPVEAVVLMERGGEVHFLPWQRGGGVPCDRVPSWEEQRDILKQRVRLPSALCHSGNVNMTIKELEEATAARFAEWRYAPLLKEELVLLLDEDLNAELNGCHISYSREWGLKCERQNNA